MEDEYKVLDFEKVYRQNEIAKKHINIETKDMGSIEQTIYITCKKIHQYYDEKNSIEITSSMLELPGLIKNESLTYIPGLMDFNIPNILFELLLFDNYHIKHASIVCLNGILRFNESESLFDCEYFCRNFLSAFLNEKKDQLLEGMLKLLDNILFFNNVRINSFFLENNILNKIISIIDTTRNQNIIQIAFNIISINCKSKLKKNDVLLIYQSISKFQSNNEIELLNIYFMKIFYNLLETDSFLCDEFINCRFYIYVRIAIQNGLSKITRYGCKIIQSLVEKYPNYECYKFFDPINFILKILFIEPKNKDENDVLCLVSAISCLNSFIGKDVDLTSFLLTETSFKNLLYLSQTRNIFFKVNLLNIFTSLYDKMTSDNFDLTFTIYNEQNIFNYLSDIIDTNDLDTVKQALILICSIFQKSVPLNQDKNCISCFQAAFTPEIFDTLENFHDETINQYIPQLKFYLSYE